MKKKNKYNVTHEQLIAEAVERLTLLKLPDEVITLMKEESLYCRYQNGVFTISKEQRIKANKKYATYYIIQEEDYAIRFLISLQPHLWASEKAKLSKGEVLVDVEEGGCHWKEVITIEHEDAPCSTVCVYKGYRDELNDINQDSSRCVRCYRHLKSAENDKASTDNPPSHKQLVNEAVERLKILKMPKEVIELMENHSQGCGYYEGGFVTTKDCRFGLTDFPLPYFVVKKGDAKYEFVISENPEDWPLEKEALQDGLAITLVCRRGHYEKCPLLFGTLEIRMDAPLYDLDNDAVRFPNTRRVGYRQSRFDHRRRCRLCTQFHES